MQLVMLFTFNWLNIALLFFQIRWLMASRFRPICSNFCVHWWIDSCCSAVILCH